MGKIYRNGKTITPSNYVEKVDNSLLETILSRKTDSDVLDLSGISIDTLGDYALYRFYTPSPGFRPKIIKLPRNCIAIGNSALFNCQGLEQIIGSENLRKLEEYVFSQCPQLKHINLQNVEAIGENCFTGCRALMQVNMPNAKRIGSSAFFNCLNLELLALPSELEYLYGRAFYGCSKITIKSIPSNIEIIYPEVFSGCSALTEITFEGDVTQIQSYAFAATPNILKYAFPANTTVPTLQTRTWDNINADCVIYVPDALYDAWIVATNWATYASKIKKISEMPTE